MQSAPKVNSWIVAGWILFLCSFMMPAFDARLNLSDARVNVDSRSQSPLSGSYVTNPPVLAVQAALSNPGEPILNGWEAMRSALDLKEIYPVCSALTNIAVLMSLITLWAREPSRWLAWLIAALGVYNLYWLRSFADDPDLKIGYYAWIASFGLVAIGLFKLANSTSITGSTDPKNQSAV